MVKTLTERKGIMSQADELTHKMSRKKSLYIVLISPHGLIRSHDLELGRDADTGGQTKYVVQLAKYLSMLPSVKRVDLFTRMIIDKKVDPSYSEQIEAITEKAHIIRIPCGPKRYIRKELLWPYLGAFADGMVRFINKFSRQPDIIHAHYADAGYIGSALADIFGVPLIFTGHSLGREKKKHLLEKKMTFEVIEKKYNITQRIQAEELALSKASLIITNSQQEIDEQYRSYDTYEPKKMVVVQPGIDLSRFSPQMRLLTKAPIYKEIARFLYEPRKPMILCLSRPDPRKNISAVLHAYGQSDELQKVANLVLMIGVRDDIAKMESGPNDVWTEILYLIDKYDLYGKVAYPKHHTSEDVPELYRIAARSRGVFINPALTEPFGLTLIEAAASGLPIIAPNDGGPKEIINFCNNGILVDTTDYRSIAETIYLVVTSKEQWRHWTINGLKGAKMHYSWEGHAKKYMRICKKLLARKARTKKIRPFERITAIDRLVISDIDNTLTGNKEGLNELNKQLRMMNTIVGFGVATGRSLEKTIDVIKKWDILQPDILITSVGSEIYYGPKYAQDFSWKGYIDHKWDPDRIADTMDGLTGIEPQPMVDQREHKLSYFIDPSIAPSIADIKYMFRELKIAVNVIFSHNQYLDILPVRASKGEAIRYISWKWNIPIQNILVSGDSGNDKQMLCIGTKAVVVSNHSMELQELQRNNQVYFAEDEYAWGVIEGINHYNFFPKVQISV